MNKDISWNAVLDLLVGDLKTEESLKHVLNFLEHASSIVRLLYWAKRLENENGENSRPAG